MLVKFENFTEILHKLLTKCVLTKVTINGKYIQIGQIYFEIQARVARCMFTDLSQVSLMNEEVTSTVSKVPFLLKHAKQI